MKQKVIETAMHLKFIRDKFLYQLDKQRGKVVYLENLWNMELQALILETAKSKTPKDKVKLKELQNINVQIYRELIKKYIERCKFKYVLAFM